MRQAGNAQSYAVHSLGVKPQWSLACWAAATLHVGKRSIMLAAGPGRARLRSCPTCVPSYVHARLLHHTMASKQSRDAVLHGRMPYAP